MLWLLWSYFLTALNSCCPPPILPWSYILFPCNPFSVSTSRYLPTLLAKLPSSYRWLHLGGWQSVLHFIFVICCSPTSTNILLQFLSYHLDPMSTLFKIYCFLYCRSIICIQSPLLFIRFLSCLFRLLFIFFTFRALLRVPLHFCIICPTLVSLRCYTFCFTPCSGRTTREKTNVVCETSSTMLN